MVKGREKGKGIEKGKKEKGEGKYQEKEKGEMGGIRGKGKGKGWERDIKIY